MNDEQAQSPAPLDPDGSERGPDWYQRTVAERTGPQPVLGISTAGQPTRSEPVRGYSDAELAELLDSLPDVDDAAVRAVDFVVPLGAFQPVAVRDEHPVIVMTAAEPQDGGSVTATVTLPGRDAQSTPSVTVPRRGRDDGPAVPLTARVPPAGADGQPSTVTVQVFDRCGQHLGSMTITGPGDRLPQLLRDPLPLEHPGRAVTAFDVDEVPLPQPDAAGRPGTVSVPVTDPISGQQVGTVQVVGPLAQARQALRERLPVVSTFAGQEHLVLPEPLGLAQALEAVDAVLAALLADGHPPVQHQDAHLVGALLARMEQLVALVPADALNAAASAYAQVSGPGYDGDGDRQVLRGLSARARLMFAQVAALTHTVGASREKDAGCELSKHEMLAGALIALDGVSEGADLVAGLLGHAADEGPCDPEQRPY